MNRPAPDMTRTTGDDGHSAAPLDELVCALIGRRVRDLRIEVRGGGPVLRGRADSYHAKQLARHAAMAVTDLPLVANRIEVACPRRGTSRPDGRVRGASRAAEELVLLATGDDRLRSSGSRSTSPSRAMSSPPRRAGWSAWHSSASSSRTWSSSRHGPALGRRGRRPRAPPCGGRHAGTRRLARLPVRRPARVPERLDRPGRLGARKARVVGDLVWAVRSAAAEVPRPPREVTGGGGGSAPAAVPRDRPCGCGLRYATGRQPVLPSAVRRSARGDHMPAVTTPPPTDPAPVVLVVDDLALVREVLAPGCGATGSRCGWRATAGRRSSCTGGTTTPSRLVLLDVQMPGLDGPAGAGRAADHRPGRPGVLHDRRPGPVRRGRTPGDGRPPGVPQAPRHRRGGGRTPPEPGGCRP